MVFNQKRAKSKVHTHYIHDPRGVAITLFGSLISILTNLERRECVVFA